MRLFHWKCVNRSFLAASFENVNSTHENFDANGARSRKARLKLNLPTTGSAANARTKDDDENEHI
jgi:hypothetical protein